MLYWLHAYDPEEDGTVDVEGLTAETEERTEWNAFGQELCARFLMFAEATPARGATTRATSLGS